MRTLKIKCTYYFDLARNVFRCSSSSSIDHNNSRNTSMLLQARDMYDKQQWLSTFRSITKMDKK